MNRALALAALASLVLTEGPLATDYSAKRDLRVETSTDLDLKTTDMEMLVDGNPVDSPWGGGGMEVHRREVHTDRVLERADGKPKRVLRRFGDVSSKGTMTFGDQDRSFESECPLGNSAIEIAVGDNGDVKVTEAEGSSLPDEALEGHEPGLALDAFLPQDEVEEGKSWDLEPDQVKRALGLNVEAALYPPPARDDDDSGGGGGPGGRGRGRGPSGGSELGLLKTAEWEGKATLTSAKEDVDGRNCAVIEIKLEASGDLPEPQFGGGRDRGDHMPEGRLALERSGAALDNDYDVVLEGKLLYDHDEKLPVSLELEGSLTTHRHFEHDMRDRHMEMTSTREGELTYKVEVSAAKQEE